MIRPKDCEGVELQTGDIIEDVITGELYEVTSKQDSMPMLRVWRVDDHYYIRHFQSASVRLVERPKINPWFRHAMRESGFEIK